ncbi:hypothetical protein Rsub_09404 [Raphidocelis subcapitata]|uniref:Uncharacterized protein n=1 Tax=Raphidocelis subcapitata TaxID=307507 RepID=A0A2V0P8Z8_9CHLO|nr:hypothetical protein Rsub_09404 [Raphidocelis subcapitata]|eukprot:GBF96334.1 hypothetical protein Rsub_09404 [Raphidocelis subcapitata]
MIEALHGPGFPPLALHAAVGGGDLAAAKCAAGGATAEGAALASRAGAPPGAAAAASPAGRCSPSPAVSARGRPPPSPPPPLRLDSHAGSPPSGPLFRLDGDCDGPGSGSGDGDDCGDGPGALAALSAPALLTGAGAGHPRPLFAGDALGTIREQRGAPGSPPERRAHHSAAVRAHHARLSADVAARNVHQWHPHAHIITVGPPGGHAAPASGAHLHAGAMHRQMLRAREVRRCSSDSVARYAAARSAAAGGGGASPGAAGGAGGAPGTPPQRRLSISVAKEILAQCSRDGGGDGCTGLLASGSGPLLPLLDRIRADGAHADGDASGSGDGPSPVGAAGEEACGSCPRRASCELWPANRRVSSDGAAATPRGGPRGSPPSPGAGCALLRRGGSGGGGSDDGAWTAESARAEAVRRLLDCLDTVAVLAVDDATRCTILSMGAQPLLSSKFAAAAAAALSQPAPEGAAAADAPAAAPAPPAAATATCEAVGTAALRALSALLRTDAARRDFWEGDGGAALRDLLARAPRAGELVAAAYGAAEALAWGAPVAAPPPSYLASDLYAGGKAGGGGGGARGGGAAAAGQPRLLEPRLVAALASSRALHPRSDPAAASLALHALLLAAQRSAWGDAGAAASDAERALVRAWRAAAFALVPLLSDGAARASRDARQLRALCAALDLAGRMCEAPGLAAALAVAGALRPLLSLAADAGGGGGCDAGGSVAARAATVVAALARRGGRAALVALREGRALAALLRGASDASAPAPAKAQLLHALWHAAADGGDGNAARDAAAAALAARGAAGVVGGLLSDGVGEADGRAGELLRALLRPGCGGAAAPRPQAPSRASVDLGAPTAFP